MPRNLRILTVSALAASGLLLAGCGATQTPAPAGSAASDAPAASERITVVTSTNVYGDIVSAIGGDEVDVTSLITSGAQDPHSYEASARDQLVVSKAQLLVGNGGGYDAFFDGLVASASGGADVLTAVEYSHDWPGDQEVEPHDGHTHDDADDHDHDHASDDHDDASDDHDGHGHIEGFNEHVWYDAHTIGHLASAIAEELDDLRPDAKATFDANLRTFLDGIAAQEAELQRIADAAAGAQVFVTEPVPLYLTAAAGLENVTPAAFTEAVEEGQDVPPATLLEALGVLKDGAVKVLIANAQTGGAETTQVIAEAKSAGIPVLEFTETLPEGQTYLRWMSQNASALAQALGV